MSSFQIMIRILTETQLKMCSRSRGIKVLVSSSEGSKYWFQLSSEFIIHIQNNEIYNLNNNKYNENNIIISLGF